MFDGLTSDYDRNYHGNAPEISRWEEERGEELDSLMEDVKTKSSEIYNLLDDWELDKAIEAAEELLAWVQEYKDEWGEPPER